MITQIILEDRNQFQILIVKKKDSNFPLQSGLNLHIFHHNYVQLYSQDHKIRRISFRLINFHHFRLAYTNISILRTYPSFPSTLSSFSFSSPSERKASIDLRRRSNLENLIYLYVPSVLLSRVPFPSPF